MMIYIGGYGRSGSTIAEMVIADQLSCFAAGELTHVFTWAREGRSCSCGRTVDKCEFWSPILTDIDQTFGLGTAEAVTASVETALRTTQADRQTYSSIWTTVFEAIHESGTFHDVVDSSKSAGGRLRALRLSQSEIGVPRPFVFVHLTRDPRGVAFSAAKGRNAAIEGLNSTDLRGWQGAARAGAGWLKANLIARWIRHRLGRDASLVVRYEDFCRDPQSVVDRIARRAELSGEREHHVGGASHSIAGNRMRRLPSTNNQISEDVRWRREMRRSMRVAFTLLLPVRWFIER